MATSKVRTNTLSYIEETPKHFVRLGRIVKKSVKRGIQVAKKNGHFVTYAKGSNIVREYPDGRIESIGQLKSQAVKVNRGEKFILH